METIRRYIGDFRFTPPTFFIPRLRLASILSTPELLVLSFMTAIGSFYFFSQENSVYLRNLKLFSNPPAVQSALEVAVPVEEYKKRHLNLISDMKDRYSFKSTSLGFFLNDLAFLEKERMDIIEKQMAASLPVYMRARAKQYIRPVLLLSEKHQIDPFWVMSIMWTESHFVPTATSSVGARGLMQIMPKTKAWIYKRYRNGGDKLVVENQMADIDYFFKKDISKNDLQFFKMKLVNIELGVIYLKYLLKKFNHNHKLATVAYNMGPGWTRYRLRNKLPVGQKNLYLTKVENAYQYLSKSI
ncbi:MAG: lytic transglycosylase domain-containing protein [Bacteriovoracaceae bacterium]